MTYMQRGSKIKQIFANLIIYTISIFLGTAALIIFCSSWDTTLGNLIIFMSPYLIYVAASYAYRLRKNKITIEEG